MMRSKSIRLGAVVVCAVSTLHAENDKVGAERSIRQSIVDVGTQEMAHGSDVYHLDTFFTQGRVGGQLELMYSGYRERGSNATGANPYSTAIGGQLQYETGHWHGFGLGVEFTTVHEIAPLSGESGKGERAVMLVSPQGSYTQLSQAYLEYLNQGFIFRAGRQVIETPLADSDDIRIVNNTFEAYTASYKTETLSWMGGFISRWQGTDAGMLDKAWQKTGKNGTWFTGITYIEDRIHLGAWYYDISETEPGNVMGTGIGNSSTYIDGTVHALANDAFSFDISTQYLHQSEKENSGTKADIYGMMLEAEVSDFGFMAAYNKRVADDDKTSFSGFGGGTLFTNMDNMIIDTIIGGDVDAYVLGASYRVGEVTVSYAYGNFQRDATAVLPKENIVEHNVVAAYAYSDHLTLSAFVTVNENKEDTGTNAINNSGDFTNLRISASYNF
jgi:hypothetical protein